MENLSQWQENPGFLAKILSNPIKALLDLLSEYDVSILSKQKNWKDEVAKSLMKLVYEKKIPIFLWLSYLVLIWKEIDYEWLKLNNIDFIYHYWFIKDIKQELKDKYFEFIIKKNLSLDELEIFLKIVWETNKEKKIIYKIFSTIYDDIKNLENSDSERKRIVQDKILNILNFVWEQDCYNDITTILNDILIKIVEKNYDDIHWIIEYKWDKLNKKVKKWIVEFFTDKNFEVLENSIEMFFLLYQKIKNDWDIEYSLKLNILTKLIAFCNWCMYENSKFKDSAFKFFLRLYKIIDFTNPYKSYVLEKLFEVWSENMEDAILFMLELINNTHNTQISHTQWDEYNISFILKTKENFTSYNEKIFKNLSKQIELIFTKKWYTLSLKYFDKIQIYILIIYIFKSILKNCNNEKNLLEYYISNLKNLKRTINQDEFIDSVLNLILEKIDNFELCEFLLEQIFNENYNFNSIQLSTLYRILYLNWLKFEKLKEFQTKFNQLLIWSAKK